jgi:hypothetical protein
LIRDFRPSDMERLREINRKVGIGYEFPDPAKMASAKVVEEDGEIVMVACARLEAQIFAAIDPDWGTPGERMRAFALLHLPIAEDLAEKGVEEAYIAVDTKAFGRRLKSFGWSQAITRWLIPIKDCLRRCGSRMAA